MIMAIVLIVVAITTIMAVTIQHLTVTTTIRTMRTTTWDSALGSNILLDYMFYGIYTIQILVLKGFIPSLKGKYIHNSFNVSNM